MIHLFAGDDAKKKIESYEKFINSLPKGTEVFTVNHNNFNEMEIESFYSGAGLFFTKCAVVFQSILDREEKREFILKKLGLLADSNNNFVFLEGKLLKPALEVFKKNKAEISLFELPKEKKEKFDSFLLANALADKDKLNLWIYFRQAMDKGVGMEELVGVLFWKVKDMILKKNFTKFKEVELKNIANKLSYLLPEARKKGLDDEATFEQFLLEIF
ncbi:MAG: hypothetical protein M3Q34_01470 [bacterium]|nr:hypothetical protein [bacterium]